MPFIFFVYLIALQWCVLPLSCSSPSVYHCYPPVCLPSHGGSSDRDMAPLPHRSGEISFGSPGQSSRSPKFSAGIKGHEEKNMLARKGNLGPCSLDLHIWDPDQNLIFLPLVNGQFIHVTRFILDYWEITVFVS